jgi:hypothetical protein
MSNEKTITDVLESPAGKAAVKDAVKGTRSRPAKVRKHDFQSVNSRLLTAYLDKLHTEGGVVVAINQSQAIGGNYEVVSYKES